MQKIIGHLDMNSYFASVEQQDNPSLRGRPVGVCEHLGGIIIAASIEAKRWGIRTGTPVWEAKKLYPKIVLAGTRAERYRHYTRKFLRIVGDYAGEVEKYSIDECFFDLTRVCNVLRPDGPADPWLEAVAVARQIKQRMAKEVGDWLRCSIGIADNKPLAKIGSDLRKPDGLVVVLPDESVPSQGFVFGENCQVFRKSDLYGFLKLTDVPGIGRRQERNLGELGIRTLAELRDTPKSHLAARFGPVAGHHLYCLGRLEGSWKAAVSGEESIKSMGHMYTLPKQYRRPVFFFPTLFKLCEMVGRRLRRKRLCGSVLYFYYYGKDYRGWAASLNLGYAVRDGRQLFLECRRVLAAAGRHAAAGLPSDIRLIGVTVAGLHPAVDQLSLFGEAEREKRLLAALDKINDRYGEFTVMRALQLPAGEVFRDSVGFGRVKELGEERSQPIA